MIARTVLLAAVSLGCARDSAPISSAARFETVATGLRVPWAIAFAPDGRVFVTERPGRIRVMQDGVLRPEPWAVLDVANTGEAGLMGIALSRTFANDGHVYVVATFRVDDALINRVLRFRDEHGQGTAPTAIVDNLPAAEFHAGNAIAFGPDGLLYIASGDARQPSDAADPRSLAGKILRYTPDGAVPAANPDPGSPVYALGLRNVQGLAWSQGGQLFATEHGPSGFPNERFRRNHDELNAIVAGGNYGWPDVAGASSNPSYISPLVDWTPAIAPSGVAAYHGSYEGWQSSLFVAGLRGRQLRRVQLERRGGRWRVSREEILFKEELGRIRAVVMAPDGFVYFTTSNWDGRGEPGAQDDRILRLIPR